MAVKKQKKHVPLFTGSLAARVYKVFANDEDSDTTLFESENGTLTLFRDTYDEYVTLDHDTCGSIGFDSAKEFDDFIVGMKELIRKIEEKK